MAKPKTSLSQYFAIIKYQIVELFKEEEILIFKKFNLTVFGTINYSQILE